MYKVLEYSYSTTITISRYWFTGTWFFNFALLSYSDSYSMNHTEFQVCNLAWSKHTNELVSTHGYSQNQILIWRYPSLTQVSVLLHKIYVYIIFYFKGCQINWSHISCFIPRHIPRRWMHCYRCWRWNTQVGLIVNQWILNQFLGFGMYSVRPVRHVSHSLFSICLMESDKWLQLTFSMGAIQIIVICPILGSGYWGSTSIFINQNLILYFVFFNFVFEHITYIIWWSL